MTSVPTQIGQDLADVGIRIESILNVSGGDINEARRVVTNDGTSYFLKYNAGDAGSKIIQSEIQGLQLLQDNHCPIPAQIHRKVDDTISYILMEWIDSKIADPERIAHNLASLHQVKHTSFGLDHSNHIGTLDQANIWSTCFVDFYMACRIQPQIKMAHDQGIDLRADMDALHHVIQREIPEDPPCLIHGDLWSGNMVYSSTQAYFIDPSVSFAHREMDLAMMNLFGGFPAAVYDIYDEIYPLESQWKARMDLFQLYYLLVHLNIFGVQYRLSVQRILDKYLS